MEADWEELGLIAHPGPGVNALSTSVTAIAFDTLQELIWTGNQFGRVMSFYGPEMQRYSSYKGHTSEPVKQILLHPKGVLSISPRSIHLSNRKGLTLWHLTHPDFLDLKCFSFTSGDVTEALVAGAQDTMFKIDVDKGVVLQQLPCDAHYTMMKKSRQYICAATNHGSVHIIDPTTLRVVKVWQAHLGLINDMDAKTDYLVTCGWSPRQQHGLMLDPLANVLSLKTLTPIPPIPFQPGAAFVRMHPRMSTTCIIASQTGQLQVIDLHNPNTVNLKQVQIYDGVYLNTMELAPSGEGLLMTDSLFQIHLWGSRAKLHFAEYSSPTVFPTNNDPKQNLDWSGKTPLNTIGMPFYREILLSSWPSNMCFEVGAPPAKPDADLAKKLKRAEMGYWAPNPRKCLRNQVEKTRTKESDFAGITAPKFLSEKARDLAQSISEERRMSDALEAFGDAAIGDVTKKNVPLMYRNVEIKYSKFGVDDFDFEYYNKTPYSGLETHITNSYTNPLLQLYRFTPVMRNLALRHTATNCLYDTCLLCELGFLIDMIEKAEGRNCQATNFLRCFSKLPNAGGLNILEEISSKTTLISRIQTANRFLMDTFAGDFRRQLSTQNRALDQIMATSATATIRCAVCNQEQVRPEAPYVHELVYPSKSLQQQSARQSRPTFSQLLKQSIERQDVKGWCSRCNRYQALSSRKHINSVAAVLNINTAISETEHKQLWCQANWLPQEIGVIVQQGQLFCYEGNDLELHIQRGVYKVQVYELVGVVCEVRSSEGQQPHLVGVINTAPSSVDTAADKNQWHLFNDFLVRQIPKDDALRFDANWKLPFILTYQLKTHSHIVDDSWKSQLDTSILYRMISTTHLDDVEHFRLLGTEETPTIGTHVGIDAEFISLQREEIEIKADGKRETVRPSRMGLARVSVLRDYTETISPNPLLPPQPDSGLPFIDDYIAVTDPIVDYLTAYSGISPGDLDRNTSSHILVSLKTAYKKLWLLLNLGCVFVGHGLLKDFRTINIHVPRKQVIDTVDLFYLPSRQRKIGLRFLAGLLLDEEIQTGMHDSIEDARTALKLYAYWKELVVHGEEEVERTLEWIYRQGYEMEWKSGGSGGGTGKRPGTASGEHLGVSRPQTGRNTPDVGGLGGLRSVAGTPRR